MLSGLKNNVKEQSNIKCYALFSESSKKKIDLPSEIFVPMTETYDHFGNVRTYVTDLTESYKKLSEMKRIIINEEEADFVAKYNFKMSPARLWEWITDNSKRELWMEETKWSKGDRPKGRMSAGATNHCVHGKDAHLEVILDWKPFEYYTYESGSKPFFIISTLKLIENGSGTEFNEIIKLKNKLPKFLRRLIVKIVALKVMKVYEGYRKIEELNNSQTKVVEHLSVV